MAGLQRQEKILVFVCGILIGSVFVSFVLKKRNEDKIDKAVTRPAAVQEALPFLASLQVRDTKEVLEMDTGKIRRFTFFRSQDESLGLVVEEAYQHDAENERILLTDRAYYSSDQLWLYTDPLSKESLKDFLSPLGATIKFHSMDRIWLIHFPNNTYKSYTEFQKAIQGLEIPLHYIAPDYLYTSEFTENIAIEVQSRNN